MIILLGMDCRRGLSLLAFAALVALLAACKKEPPPAPEAPATAEPAEPEPEAEDAPEPEPEPEPPRPVEQLSEEELEAECFRGRTEACDLLGH